MTTFFAIVGCALLFFGFVPGQLWSFGLGFVILLITGCVEAMTNKTGPQL